MIPARLLVLGALAAAACGADRPPAAPSAQPCDQRVSELRAWLAELERGVDARPWPTGDAATDAEIDRILAELRGRRDAPLDEQLSNGIERPDPFERLLAGCPPALRAYQRAAEEHVREREAAPGSSPSLLAVYASVADRMTACDCTVSIELFKARVYLALLDPDRYDAVIGSPP